VIDHQKAFGRRRICNSDDTFALLKSNVQVLFRESRHLVRLEHQLPCAGEELFKMALCNFCDFTKPLSGTLSMIEFISDIEFVSDIDQISLVSPIAAP
jgi:hypothetical protein